MVDVKVGEGHMQHSGNCYFEKNYFDTNASVPTEGMNKILFNRDIL